MNGLHPIPSARAEGETLHWPRPGPAPAAPAVRLPRPGGWLKFEEGQLTRDQLIRNLELAVSVLQTASRGLNEIDEVLTDLAAALGTYWSQRERSPAPPEELRRYVAHKIDALDEIARLCRFHGRGLLDGQSGVVGYGEGVLFVRGGPNTASSPPEGYEILISALPTRAYLAGGIPVHEHWIWAEREIFLAEGERFIRYAPRRAESVGEFLANLQRALFAAGLDLEVGMTAERQLLVRHTHFGSQYKFKGSSLTTPLLSRRPGKLEWSRKGRDIQGTLSGEPAFGIGRTLVGYLDNPNTSELAVCWRGERPGEGGAVRCHVLQNGIVFQDGDDPQSSGIRLSLPSFHSAQLGQWVDTRSGFASLTAARAETWQELLDSLYLLLSISGEVEEWKERLKAWVERYQNRALNYLRQGGGGVPGLPEGVEAAGVTQDMATVLRRYIHGGPAIKA